jgi:hypothetical protein
MLEALCRQSSTTLDIVHAGDGPPITQRTSGLEDAGCEESVVGLVIPTGYSFNLDVSGGEHYVTRWSACAGRPVI